MKLIVAIIQPDKLDEVHQALIHAEIFRITVSRVTGHGQQEDQELYRGEEVKPDLIPKVRLEIAVNDAWNPVSFGANGGGDNIKLTVPPEGGAYRFTFDQRTHVPSVEKVG